MLDNNTNIYPSWNENIYNPQNQNIESTSMQYNGYQPSNGLSNNEVGNRELLFNNKCFNFSYIANL